MNLFRLARVFAAFICVWTLIGALAAQSSPGYVAREDGAWIHYLSGGQSAEGSPAFLFVPGWMMPAWIWNPQLESLQDSYHVVAMSPRSQGRSSKETDGHYPAARAADIKAVIDELELSPVILVAWSLGVAEAAAFVETYGTESLAGLVLVDGLAGTEDPGRFFSGSFRENIAMLQRNRAAATRNFIASMFKSRRNPEYLDELTRASLATPTNSAMALLVGSLAFDHRPALSQIDVPTLIAAAGGDQRPDWAQYQAMQQAIAGSRLEVFADAGHALFVDEPTRFNRMLRDFAGQVAGSGRR